MKKQNILRGYFHDFLTLYLPIKKRMRYGYAFLIHMREIDDLYRKFPSLKYVPKKILQILTLLLWPVTVSQITGLKNQETKEEIPGWIIAIPVTAATLLKDRKRALQKIKRAAILADKKGAEVIGLGAMTASLSRGGHDLLPVVGAAITSGHAYTVFNVTSTLLEIAKRIDVPLEKSTLAIVGGAGSIGSNSARILFKNNFKKLILIDTPKKRATLEQLRNELIGQHAKTAVVVSVDITDVKEAHFVVSATSAPEALIRGEYLKTGAVVVDDAQPSDIDESAFNREDVLILEAGAVKTPGIKSNFNIDLHNPDENFSCMAELMILAARGCGEEYGIKKTTIEAVHDMEKFGKELGFSIAQFQNKNEIISEKKIAHIRNLNTQ